MSAVNPVTIASACLPFLVPLFRLAAPLLSKHAIDVRRLLATRTHELVRDARTRDSRPASPTTDSDASPPAESKLRAQTGSFLVNLARVKSKTTGHELSESVIAAQAALMLIAGFETTASALSMAVWLLATRPEVQAKLQRELDAQIAAAGGIDHAVTAVLHHTEESSTLKYVCMSTNTTRSSPSRI